MSNLYNESDQQPPRAGLLLLQTLILGVFCLFAVRLWYLQIHRGEEYALKARDNQLRQEAVFSPRGLIRDRNGDLLAVNEPAYALGIVREDCPDIDKLVQQIADWTGKDFLELKTLYNKNRKRVKPFEPLIVIPDLDFEQLALIETNKLRWPGLEIQFRPRRLYRYGTLFAHVLGYVAEANEEDMGKKPELALGDYVGKQGIEFMLEDRMRGIKGLTQFEVDVNGRRLKERVLKHPQAGHEISLSLDLGLQKLAMDWLEEEAGGVAVMDADTGQLWALATAPSYNSNDFSSGLTPDQWAKLRDNPLHPMQNRVIQSVYPPGSIFKHVVAGAGLHYGMLDPKETVFCSGSTKLGRRVFRCWRKGGHGNVNLDRALVESCDVYFYKMGKKLTVDRMSEFAQAVGFGHKTGIRLPHEKAGIMPTKEWKQKRFGESWQGGDNLNMAIGQGYTLVTPLQVVRFFAGILNGGKLLKPLLLKDEKTVVQAEIPLDQGQIERLRRALVETVNDAHGTCRRIRTKDVVVGGKTGTAQVVRLTDELKELKDDQIPYKFRDHAWMAAIAEKDGRRFAIAVLVEHGLHGGSGAGPIVKAVIDYLFLDKVTPNPEERKSKAKAVRALSLKKKEKPRAN
ncbi:MULTISPECIES: penicillin-binding protein 2 [unclassified Pseudodesulfovibrio]|uniref:penicillin-binding protein 2 n=1 Tax=unclassified Pseudodesulfovibrio TaxID=2661612 RepID=UPI000FEB7BE0|nr:MULTISPECIES: penicillin-binding protein 2 [unclassified Pseudodesulfovibrio]MCJ2165429.1 penicillin-binding protein 2 [Pseudodesulfovibrio sp. S3-i]RWU03179.1 penicillin-binding protein 2 [Pseudodesulfovibrio sp. S3]